MYSAEERAFAQSCYLEKIKEKAKDQFDQLTQPPPPRTDIQGRLIFDVQLNDNDIKEILTAISKNKSPEKDSENTENKTLEDLLGHPLTATTTVSYDTSNPELVGNFYLSQHLTNVEKQNMIDLYDTLVKDRIINLRHETYFHAQLIGRMLKTALLKEKKYSQDKDSAFQEGLKAAMSELEDKIYELEAKALEKAYKKNVRTGNDKEQFQKDFNQELDSARKKLLPEIAKAVREQVIKKTGILFDKDVTNQLTKELAKKTTATPNDVVHISKAMGAISYMGGSDKTSHHQELGANYVADKLIYSHHLTADGKKVQPLALRQHVRIPALAIKALRKETMELLDNGKNTDLTDKDDAVKREYELMRVKIFTRDNDPKKISKDIFKKAFDAVVIEDTVGKLNYLQKKYRLGDSIAGVQSIPRAFVYNLYTSINDESKTLDSIDERKNKQTQSASHILQAAHQYNKKALNNYNEEIVSNFDQNLERPIRKPLCLVQNIPVNGWGHSIKRDAKNPTVVNEAALMSELATLHTVFDVLSEQDKKNAKEIFNEYDAFLKDPDSSFFYEYLTDGNKLAKSLSLLDEIKNNTLQPNPETEQLTKPSSPPDEFLQQVKCALAQFFKNGAYSDLANGYTYQALSVFAEPSSLGGCKSANERSQAVNGRVSILDFINLPEESRNKLLSNYQVPELKAEADALKKAIIDKDLPGVVKNMDNLYGKLNLEGFQALISMIDQGGHAKLATHGSTWLPNTNASETVYTNTANASKWQCHKGLIDNVQEAFTGVNPSKVKKKMQNILIEAGVAGGATGLVLGLGLGLNAGPLIATALGISAAFPPAGLIITLAAAIPFFAYAVLKTWQYFQPLKSDCFAKKLQENTDWVSSVHDDKSEDKDQNPNCFTYGS